MSPQVGLYSQSTGPLAWAIPVRFNRSEVTHVSSREAKCQERGKVPVHRASPCSRQFRSLLSKAVCWVPLSFSHTSGPGLATLPPQPGRRSFQGPVFSKEPPESGPNTTQHSALCPLAVNWPSRVQLLNGCHLSIIPVKAKQIGHGLTCQWGVHMGIHQGISTRGSRMCKRTAFQDPDPGTQAP